MPLILLPGDLEMCDAAMREEQAADEYARLRGLQETAKRYLSGYHFIVDAEGKPIPRKSIAEQYAESLFRD